jgi:hypothetical protein
LAAVILVGGAPAAVILVGGAAISFAGGAPAEVILVGGAPAPPRHLSFLEDLPSARGMGALRKEPDASFGGLARHDVVTGK